MLTDQGLSMDSFSVLLNTTETFDLTTRNVTARFSTIHVANRRTATRFDPTRILPTPVTNLVVQKSRTRSRSRTCQI